MMVYSQLPWWEDDDGCIASGTGDDYKTVGEVFDKADRAITIAAVNYHDRLVELAKYVATIREYADTGKPLLSNQGQALDGYSELAEYRGIAKKASVLLKELED